MRASGWFATGLIVLLGACASYKPGPATITLEPGREGRIHFTSLDVYDFPDVIRNRAPTRIIHGDLTLPTGDAEIRGAVIISHGSAGVNSLYDRYIEMLSGMGLAVFRLDHFGPRNVGSTVRGQIRVTEQGMLADVVAAQRLLATHPEIDAERVGVIGWSKGGITAVTSAVERLTRYMEAPAPLAFAAAFYPFCGFDVGAEKLASPLLIQIGSADDWTPAPPCQEMVEALKANRQPAEIVVYPDALHGFDSRLPDTEFSTALTVRKTGPECRLRVDGDGRTVTLDGKNSIGTLDERITYLRACASRGVSYGGQAEARKASTKRLVEFVDKHLPARR